jgi:hypothetical protein
MIRSWRNWLGLCLLSGFVACQWPTESSDSHSGLTSVIRVEGGQAMRGSIADPGDASPSTAKLFPKNTTIFPGVTKKSIKGTVGPDANAVALGVAGDSVYWLVPALSPDATDSHAFTFTASLSVSPLLAKSLLLVANGDGTSTLPLSARAIDAAGNFGIATIQPFIMDAQRLTGTLIVSLDWDAPVDLDLHALVPAANDVGYVEVWSKARSANTATSDGTLDFDSNANCQIDGRDVEDVVWTDQPPAGHYTVRVGLASLCGQSSAAWHAVAYSPSGILGEASGVLTEAATRQNPAAGAGLTVIEFDYP